VTLPLFWILSLLYELFPAFGASDGDLTLASGNTDRLAALGTLKITVFPILDPVDDLTILPVFLITLISVPGQASENHKTQEAVGNQRQYHIGTICPDEHGQNAAHHTHAQQGHIQMVITVTAGHKVSKRRRESAEKLMEHRQFTLTVTVIFPPL